MVPINRPFLIPIVAEEAGNRHRGFQDHLGWDYETKVQRDFLWLF